jgi:hypothetical protein
MTLARTCRRNELPYHDHQLASLHHPVEGVVIVDLDQPHEARRSRTSQLATALDLYQLVSAPVHEPNTDTLW